MTDESIKEAVELLKKDGYWGENKNVKAFDVLLDLAEQYLKLAGKMPEKQTYSPSCDDEDYDEVDRAYIQGFNQARQSCILAFMAGLPSDYELIKLIEKFKPCTHLFDQCDCPDWKPDLAKAIHQRLETGREEK